MFAQRLTPTVISNAGDVMKAGNFSIEWTLGELAVETFKNGNSTLTQGFHQGQIIITKTHDAELSGYKIYPNPTIENLIIENSNNDAAYELISGGGALIQRSSLLNGINQIQMQQLPAGNYMLQLIQGDKHQTYKIVKN